jgi:hypothetical protein
MDESFFLRARRLLDRQPAALTHADLLAQLAARQAACPTVQASREPAAPRELPGEPDAVAALILGESGWRRAASIQHGCFNRAAAIRRVIDV